MPGAINRSANLYSHTLRTVRTTSASSFGGVQSSAFAFLELGPVVRPVISAPCARRQREPEHGVIAPADRRRRHLTGAAFNSSSF